MAFDPAAYLHLDGLATKYRDWLTQVTSDAEAGQPILNADGIESSLADCFADALVTAQALYVYLVENDVHDPTPPESEAVLRPLAAPVDVLADTVDVSAGQNERYHPAHLSPSARGGPRCLSGSDR